MGSNRDTMIEGLTLTEEQAEIYLRNKLGYRWIGVQMAPVPGSWQTRVRVYVQYPAIREAFCIAFNVDRVRDRSDKDYLPELLDRTAKMIVGAGFKLTEEGGADGN